MNDKENKGKCFVNQKLKEKILDIMEKSKDKPMVRPFLNAMNYIHNKQSNNNHIDNNFIYSETDRSTLNIIIALNNVYNNINRSILFDLNCQTK